MVDEIKKAYEFVKTNIVMVLGAIAGILFLLFKREQNKAAEAAAAAVAAEKRGEVNVLQKETKRAEKEASDSRSEYERLAAPHRKGE